MLVPLRWFFVLAGGALMVACAARPEPAPTPAPIVVTPVASASALRVQENRAQQTPADVPAPAERSKPVTAECPKSCHGVANSALESALAKGARGTRSCYNRALAQDPTLSGKMIVQLTINEDGSVCRSDIKKNEVSPSLNDCVTSAMAGPYPPPTSGCADVVIPINFVGQSADAGTP